MDWFRMYGDMPNDPKIGTLSDAEFRTWVELLCMACKAEKDGSTGLTMDTVSWALRRNVTETFQKLIETNLIFINVEKEIVITAWEKRQYSSDSSTGRVQKHREKLKNQDLKQDEIEETLQKRSSNGLEQNRADTEQIQKEPLKNKPKRDPSGFASFWTAYPRKVKRPAAEKAFNKIDIALLDRILASIAAFKKSEEWLAENGKYIPHPATWLNDKRWEDEVSQSTAYRPIIPIVKPPDEPRNYKPAGIAPLKSLIKNWEPA